MAKVDRTIRRILSGSSDQNIAFRDVRRILVKLGFSLRINGSHHIFFKEGIDEILNLQPKAGKAEYCDRQGFQKNIGRIYKSNHCLHTIRPCGLLCEADVGRISDLRIFDHVELRDTEEERRN